ARCHATPPTAIHTLSLHDALPILGEGSWGAPARSANNPRPWTIDLASIQQFKVITVSKKNVEVRTAQFDETASTLSLTDRNKDATRLPDNVNWWSANGVGETLILIQSSAGRTKIGRAHV